MSMDIRRFIGDSENDKFSGCKNYGASPKDIKKKLSCINKRINDLHRGRKLLYKDSVKVKKVVHNQINQIVKCLRARERAICSEVDDHFFTEDSNISDEISKLQSVYAHGQAVLSNIEDFKEKSDVLRKIETILSEINFDEKFDVKALEFQSDFEMMKIKATSYGYVKENFVKKENFVYVDEEKDNKISDDRFKTKELLIQKFSSKNVVGSSKQVPFCKTTDCDDFQIIDLLDNMNCQDTDDDFVMNEDVNCNTSQTENNLSLPISNKTANTFRIKEYNTLKSSSEDAAINIDFNPEEEWKEILEMNKKLANMQEMVPTVWCPKKSVNYPKVKGKTLTKKDSNSNRFIIMKDANSWLLHSTYSKNGETPRKMCEINSTSPAEIIIQAFKCYMAKDNIQNWLSVH